MKILVLNGSPKGNTSVTMAYVRYLQATFPAHQFSLRHVVPEIGRLEKDPAHFEGLMAEVRQCDLVLWAFPLYYMLVHSHYKRFIELVSRQGATAAFDGKYGASLSTSIRFYDHTAHEYIRAVSEDLGMQFAGAFSAAMDDLRNKKTRLTLRTFMEELTRTVSAGIPLPRTTLPLTPPELNYSPAPVQNKIQTGGKKIVVITDTQGAPDNLRAMIARFCDSLEGDVTVADLSDVSMKGGCLGCIRCGYDNTCVYDGQDTLREFYTQTIFPADILVFAAHTRDRYLSARWKTFVDRRFFMTHQPGFPGKQLAYLISGPVEGNNLLHHVLAAQAETDMAHLNGVITDTRTSGGTLDTAITSLAAQLVSHAAAGYCPPGTFLGVGGRKIFRDELWGSLRFVFRADYDYYRRNGMMKFPTGNFLYRLLPLAMLALKIPAFRKGFQKSIRTMMPVPLEKCVVSVAATEISPLQKG